MYNIFDFVELLGTYNFQGNGDGCFSNTKTLDIAEQDTIVWINPTRVDRNVLFNNTKGGVVICHSDEDFIAKENQLLLKVHNPKLVFSEIVNKLFIKNSPPLIHPTAIIDSRAILDRNVSIGPFCNIGKCTIGKGTIIGSNTTIEENSVIGNNVIIKSGVCIGSDGYGYVKTEDNRQIKFPHIGGVVIEDNVHIGANTCIDRGSLGNTVIGMNTKVDNLVHIAHNVRIGDNCNIVALTVIGGSTVIGNNTWVSPSVCIRDGISIGNNSFIGMGAVVTKSIPDDELWIGNPAKFFKKTKLN